MQAVGNQSGLDRTTDITTYLLQKFQRKEQLHFEKQVFQWERNKLLMC